MLKLSSTISSKLIMMPVSSMGVTHVSFVLNTGKIIPDVTVFNCNLVKDLPDDVSIEDIVDVIKVE